MVTAFLGNIQNPAGITIDSGNNVYVVNDQVSNVFISKFASNGSFIGQTPISTDFFGLGPWQRFWTKRTI